MSEQAKVRSAISATAGVLVGFLHDLAYLACIICLFAVVNNARSSIIGVKETLRRRDKLVARKAPHRL